MSLITKRVCVPFVEVKIPVVVGAVALVALVELVELADGTARAYLPTWDHFLGGAASLSTLSDFKPAGTWLLCLAIVEEETS